MSGVAAGGDERTWLELLLANTDQAGLDARRADLIERSTDEAERARIAHVALLADQLRSQLQEHRQRASELAALYDLALRLSGVHDLTALLQDCVTQARRLLDVNVAYLAMLETDGSLTIQVTDGSMGPQLRGIRMPPHSGLAGRVVDKREPVQSIDYLEDPELEHADVLDEAAQIERLRTILGAPLRLRGEVIGVLMVAQRDVRSFSAGELSLLSSLAAFSAVAIDNARLIEDYKAAAADLSQANAQLVDQVDLVNRAATLHDHLLSIALRGDGVEDVIVSLSTVVDGTVCYLDESDRVIVGAYGGVVKAGAAACGAPPSELFRDPAARRTASDEHAVTVPVSSADSYFGALQVQPDGPFGEWDVRMLERAAMTLALVASVEVAVVDAERRTSSELIEQLVTRRVDDEATFARRARPMGLDIGAAHVVAVLDPVQVDAGRVLAHLAELVGRSGGLCARVLGHLVAVVRGDEAVVREFVARHPQSGTVGIAGPARGVSGIAGAYDDALACVTVLHGLDRAGACASPADLGPYRFLLSRSSRADAKRFVAVTIGPLIDNDRERNTELVKTADAFLTNGRQHAATATALNIHANTLYQRLDRITSLLGETWRVGDSALDVQMALRIHRLIRRMGGAV